MVNSVGWDGEDGVLRKVVVAECDAGAGGDDAGEAERRGGVYAEGFFDYLVEAVVCSVSVELGRASEYIEVE